MGSVQNADRSKLASFDWEAARGFMPRAVRMQCRGAGFSEQDIQDVAQDALLRLVRYLRTASADNAEALMTSIAQRAIIDRRRERQRWALLLRPLPENADPPAQVDQADPLADPAERVRWFVLSYFETRSSTCREHAAEYFAENSWEAVAVKKGSTAAAIRKQWSRCLEALRQAVAADPQANELLAAWSLGDGA